MEALSIGWREVKIYIVGKVMAYYSKINIHIFFKIKKIYLLGSPSSIKGQSKT